MKANAIKIYSHINAPVDLVWELWTSPKHIIKWNTASDDWHTTKAENDLKIGGEFKARMEAKDGSMGFDFSGNYIQVKKNELLSYKLDDQREVEVRFINQGNTTSIEEIFEPESTNPVDMQRDGWQAILDNFKRYVEEHNR